MMPYNFKAIAILPTAESREAQLANSNLRKKKPKNIEQFVKVRYSFNLIRI